MEAEQMFRADLSAPYEYEANGQTRRYGAGVHALPASIAAAAQAHGLVKGELELIDPEGSPPEAVEPKAEAELEAQ